jgi:signal transduction histidine kinase
MRSLRSRLILASVLWTTGLLMLMHMLSLMLIHVFPIMRGVHSALAIVVSLIIMAAGAQVARRSLTPFGILRQKLAAIRAGQDRSLSGSYPSEVQPLVNDLNALLDDREKAIKRAFATAGDLAHGLKTPLALLAHEADRAAVAGHHEIADGIGHQVDRMSRQVNYHLARARAIASGPTSATACPVACCADALVRTLAKLHAARELAISSAVRPDISVLVQREDFEEIIGNLLDNACKWAATKVALVGVLQGNMIVLTVDDDGPGLAPDLRTVVLARGVRLDETIAGSGLGLAIVRDLAELYGGSLSLADSPLGGLRAQVSLPAAPLPTVVP